MFCAEPWPKSVVIAALCVLFGTLAPGPVGVAAQDLTPDMIHGFVEAVYRPPQAGARICAPVCARVCSGHEAMLTAEVTREMSPPWLGQ